MHVYNINSARKQLITDTRQKPVLLLIGMLAFIIPILFSVFLYFLGKNISEILLRGGCLFLLCSPLLIHLYWYIKGNKIYAHDETITLYEDCFVHQYIKGAKQYEITIRYDQLDTLFYDENVYTNDSFFIVFMTTGQKIRSRRIDKDFCEYKTKIYEDTIDSYDLPLYFDGGLEMLDTIRRKAKEKNPLYQENFGEN